VIEHEVSEDPSAGGSASGGVLAQAVRRDASARVIDSE